MFFISRLLLRPFRNVGHWPNPSAASAALCILVFCKLMRSRCFAGVSVCNSAVNPRKSDALCRQVRSNSYRPKIHNWLRTDTNSVHAGVFSFSMYSVRRLVSCSSINRSTISRFRACIPRKESSNRGRFFRTSLIFGRSLVIATPFSGWAEIPHPRASGKLVRRREVSP